MKYDNSQRNGRGGRDYGESEYVKWILHHDGTVSAESGEQCIRPVRVSPQERGGKGGNEVVEPGTAWWCMLRVSGS